MTQTNQAAEKSWLERQRAGYKLLFLLVFSSFLLNVQIVWIQLAGLSGVIIFLLA